MLKTNINNILHFNLPFVFLVKRLHMNNEDLKAKRVQIGTSLMLLRLKKNYNKLFMSRLTGLSRHTINNLETGARSSSLDTLIIYKEGLKKNIIFEDVE
jgi:DNA-binding XRE family transcriptional regulator